MKSAKSSVGLRFVFVGLRSINGFASLTNSASEDREKADLRRRPFAARRVTPPTARRLGLSSEELEPAIDRSQALASVDTLRDVSKRDIHWSKM